MKTESVALLDRWLSEYKEHFDENKMSMLAYEITCKGEGPKFAIVAVSNERFEKLKNHTHAVHASVERYIRNLIARAGNYFVRAVPIKNSEQVIQTIDREDYFIMFMLPEVENFFVIDDCETSALSN